MKKILALALSAAFALTSVGFATAAEPTNSECTITGDQTSETLFGTKADDVICGMGGNDIIYALEGDDIIIGGDGDDYIDAGHGNDDVWGGLGADDIYGDAGTDELYGGEGNDGLNGGSNVDVIRGQGGLDICVNFAGDDYLKSDCFYDRTAPTLKSIAFETANTTVDATKPGAKLQLRALVIDNGSGLFNLDVSFAPTSKLGNGDFFVQATVYSATRTCQSIIDWNNTWSERQKPVEGCLLSGTPNRGVYLLDVGLPKNMPKGEYSIAELRMEDQAHNVQRWEYQDLAKMKLQQRFVQTGTPDRSAPKITSATIIGSRVLHDNVEKITARIAFSDAGGGTLKRFWLHYDVPESGYGLDPVISQGFKIIRAPKPCGQEEQEWDPCLVSGTASRGVLQFYMDLDPNLNDLKYVWKAQKLVPSDYSLEDSNGNTKQSVLSSELAKSLTFYKGFSSKAPVDDKDTVAPTLAEFSVDKTKVDTGMSAQTVTVKLTIKDYGVGVNRYGDDVRLELTGPTASASCSPVGNATGSNNLATFTFKCVLDAHLADGDYKFWLNVEDMSMRHNSLFLEPKDIKKNGRIVVIKNG